MKQTPFTDIQHMTTIVVIGYVWPEPNSSAAGSRMMQLLTFFKAHCDQLIFASPAQLSDHREDLSSLNIIEKSIQLNCNSFDQWIADTQPCLVLFDRFMMEEQFGWRVEQQCPNCIRILDTEDLHSLREARHLQLKEAIKAGEQLSNERRCTQALYQCMSTLDICQREIAAIYRCDLSLMISEFEISLLVELFNVPSHILLHLPFMLTTPDSALSVKQFSQREHFVTIGNFRHAPNWDSVLWLKTQIWPKIRKQLPSAQLHIYGAYPSKKVTDLHNPKHGFYIQGWASDPLQVLNSARICLSPLRFGAGIKGKFTDAMLCSTPSITTDIGVESMSGDLPWPGVIANCEETIAMAAVDLYQSESIWLDASCKAIAIIEQRYNQDTIRLQLSQSISLLQENINDLREQNFTGLMLRHHHHKSTKYMSQWIEAKNRTQ
jgi:glycosyltransferase involved in cell wall biosynthesis